MQIGKKVVGAFQMRDSTSLLESGDMAGMCRRLATDGYLYLKGVIDRGAVLRAGEVVRQAVTDALDSGRVDPNLRHVVAGPGSQAGREREVQSGSETACSVQ